MFMGCRKHIFGPRLRGQGPVGISWGLDGGIPAGSLGLGASLGVVGGTPIGSLGLGIPAGPGSGCTGWGAGFGTLGCGGVGLGVSDMA